MELTAEKLQEIKKRLEKYREWSKDMPVGELISHKPMYKYIARDYCADVGALMTNLEASQQQLAEAQTKTERWVKLSRDWQHEYFKAKAEWIEVYRARLQAKTLISLRTRLDEALLEKDKLSKYDRVIPCPTCADLRAQLAASQAEVERRGILIDQLREGLMGEQAE